MQAFLRVQDWSVHRPPDHAFLELRDPAGTPRARVLGLGPRRLHARPRQVLDVQLPDGSTTTLRNGLRRWGTRRSRTRGVLPLAGSVYVLQHRTDRRARVLRDGAWVATARREVRGDPVEVRAPLTPQDELACALLVHVLRPGRSSMLGSVAELFATGG